MRGGFALDKIGGFLGLRSGGNKLSLPAGYSRTSPWLRPSINWRKYSDLVLTEQNVSTIGSGRGINVTSYPQAFCTALFRRIAPEDQHQHALFVDGLLMSRGREKL